MELKNVRYKKAESGTVVTGEAWEKCGRVVRKGKTYNYAELKSSKSYSIMMLYIGNIQAMEIS